MKLFESIMDEIQLLQDSTEMKAPSSANNDLRKEDSLDVVSHGIVMEMLSFVSY